MTWGNHSCRTGTQFATTGTRVFGNATGTTVYIGNRYYTTVLSLARTGTSSDSIGYIFQKAIYCSSLCKRYYK